MKHFAPLSLLLILLLTLTACGAPPQAEEAASAGEASATLKELCG